jgi:hypothetical protein
MEGIEQLAGSVYMSAPDPSRLFYLLCMAYDLEPDPQKLHFVAKKKYTALSYNELQSLSNMHEALLLRAAKSPARITESSTWRRRSS